jgi:hypothetical protein
MMDITMEGVASCARRPLGGAAHDIGEGEEEGDGAGVWFTNLVTSECIHIVTITSASPSLDCAGKVYDVKNSLGHEDRKQPFMPWEDKTAESNCAAPSQHGRLVSCRRL